MLHSNKGFSTRRDGSMYLAATNWKSENIINRERFFKSLGLTGKKIVAANLVHGTRVEIVTEHSPEFLLNTDALITAEKDIVLTLTAADCFPVYFEDTEHGIIGLAHAGWRGIVGDIVPQTLEKIVSLGGKKEDIIMTIGPGICMKHFEIQPDLLSSFSPYPEAIKKENKRIFIDLKKIIVHQAFTSGILLKNIIYRDECTSCLPEKYFSYRREKPAYLETQVAYILK